MAGRQAEQAVVKQVDTEKHISVCIMAAAVKDVKALFKKLNTKWTSKPRNLKECGELLAKLKVRKPSVSVGILSLGTRPVH